jgi:hypothetical protein
VLKHGECRGAEPLWRGPGGVPQVHFPSVGEGISSDWIKFGYPLSYTSDILEALEVLAGLGHAHDPRLANAIQFALAKQDAQGRWKLERTLNGKMWVDIEQRGKPSKWVTLRALRVLKAVGT